jgi:hypothetical protein
LLLLREPHIAAPKVHQPDIRRFRSAMVSPQQAATQTANDPGGG